MRIRHKTKFRLEKMRVGDPKPYEVKEWEGNKGLNEGLNLLTSLLCGGAGTAYNAANAYIGVGNGTTTAAAAQTGLQGASKFYQAMASTYPTSGTLQQAVWKAIIDDGDAEFDWQEVTVSNSNSDSGVNLLRGTKDIGVKAPGDIWSMTVTVTFS